MSQVVMYGSVSVDGYIADEHDQPGTLFEWLSSGDVPLGTDGQLMVSRPSFDYTTAYWDRIGVTIAGRRVFDLTDGWDGTPPSGVDHMVVVTHRPPPGGLEPPRIVLLCRRCGRSCCQSQRACRRQDCGSRRGHRRRAGTRGRSR